MLSIVVLGTAAGGGIPQWNCGCENCRAARTDGLVAPATQASVAFSVDREHWFLINASPDIRQQIAATPVLHPRLGALRHSPIAGVILANGEVDAVAGLLSLREGTPFGLYAHARVLAILEQNSIFDVLHPKIVTRRAVETDRPFEPVLADGRLAGVEILPFAAPGKPALFMEERAQPDEGDTLGFVVRDKDSQKSFVYLAACAAVTPAMQAHLKGTNLVFFDGTLWRDDELIALGLAKKTGGRMGHVAMQESLRALEGLAIEKRVFLHINNSNPVLVPGSPERHEVEAAGWHIPADGMGIVL